MGRKEMNSAKKRRVFGGLGFLKLYCKFHPFFIINIKKHVTYKELSIFSNSRYFARLSI